MRLLSSPTKGSDVRLYDTVLYYTIIVDYHTILYYILLHYTTSGPQVDPGVLRGGGGGGGAFNFRFLDIRALWSA